MKITTTNIYLPTRYPRGHKVQFQSVVVVVVVRFVVPVDPCRRHRAPLVFSWGCGEGARWLVASASAHLLRSGVGGSGGRLRVVA